MHSSSLNSNTWLLVAFAFIVLKICEPRRASLGNLPAELKQKIARLVDPIGLISLSQTNCHFRYVIEVEERQRIERLLALECIPKHGGSPTLFTNWYDKPAWHQRDRLEARWACTGCMRLRPYYRFQYKFLSEVIWRKPMPGSPRTNVFTSWEPTQRGVAAQITPSADGGRSLQDCYQAIVGDIFRYHPAYLLTLYQFHQVGYMAGFTVRDLQQMILFNPQELRRRLRLSLIAMENSGVFGSDRYFRKCIECQFKSDVFNNATIASHNGLYGTEKFPIISIENHLISSPLDRYFPGILESLQQGRPRGRFYNGYPKLWPVWMARCPRCAKWKELSVFRIGAGAGGLPGRELESWEPAVGRLTWDGVILTQDVFEKARCNECFMKQNGRIALADYLGRWFQFLVEQQPDDVQSELLEAVQTFMASGVLLNHPQATAWS
ncbi:hypothetical protein FPHYL_265 [Fusarium phyllophilum]|uniref:F-box domain-containing protein n=1 Tax=Fusarium phyllophilum TaxID=47803 RepID=A0A8H5KDW4_9HYPO|nr:hypothetical protein FPHYL_265 [Fusarium phyllophilum]